MCSFFFPTWVWGKWKERGGRCVCKLLAIRSKTDLRSDSTKQTIWIKLPDGDYMNRKSICSKYINRELMERAFTECLAANNKPRQNTRGLYNLCFSFVFFRSPWRTNIKLYFFCFASCKINSNNQLKLVLCQQAIVCDNSAGSWKKIALFPWPPQYADKCCVCSIYNLKPIWVGF